MKKRIISIFLVMFLLMSSWQGIIFTSAYDGITNGCKTDYEINVDLIKEADINVKRATINQNNIKKETFTTTYNGEPRTLSFSSQTPGVVFKFSTSENGTYTTTIPEFVNAGSYTIYYKATASGYIAKQGSAILVIEPVKLTVTAENKSKIYGNADPSLTWKITSGQMVKNETLTGITCTRVAGNSVNTSGYTITPSQPSGANSNYAITFVNGKLTINPKTIGIQWGQCDFVYDGKTKVPSATATDLVTGDTCNIIVIGEQINVGEYTATASSLSNSNYKLPTTGLTKTFKINKAEQKIPSVVGVSESISKKNDGKITGVDNTMEYRKEDDTTYTAISNNEIINLPAGRYYVRYAETANYNASEDKLININSGRELLVKLPTPQKGYTLIGNKKWLTWHENAVFYFALSNGYSKTEDFAIKVNGKALSGVGDTYTYENIEDDIIVTVEGVVDNTAPTAEIELDIHKWNTLQTDILFDIYYNQPQKVKITASDVNEGSGLNKVYYYLSSSEMTEDEISSISEWIEYTEEFEITPDNKYIIYVKAEDNAGNVTYVSSTGIVMDETLPTAEIELVIHKWNTLQSDIPFDIYYNQPQKVKITASDVNEGSGLNKVYYYLSSSEMTEDEISSISEWIEYKEEFEITPDNKYIIYVKAEDNAGNVTYISSTGIILDNVSPTIIDIENDEVYYGGVTFKVLDDDIAEIWVDGIEVVLINGVYTLQPKNREQVILVKDKSGNITEYKVNVFETYKVMFVADGKVIAEQQVNYGASISNMPSIPTKKGYDETAPIWDNDGKNITKDTVITAIYTPNAPKNDNSLNTGDSNNSSVQLCITLMMHSAIIFFATFIYGRKKKII